MQNETRVMFDTYLSTLAALNGVGVASIERKFTVTPAIQQRLESKIQESSQFLSRINIVGVNEQEGDVIGLGISGPIASTTDTSQSERQTSDLHTLDSKGYRCTQTNYDTHIKYATLDMWAGFPDFQIRIRDNIIQRMALDRMMIGFNGTSRAETSDKQTNPLLQDVNIGWLEKIRINAPQRNLYEVQKDSGKITVGANGDYKTLDALVFDAVNDLIEPWFRSDTKLVALTGRRLMADKLFPLLNIIQPPTEQKAASDIIQSQQRVGNIGAIQVPSFPENAILITRLDNLSIYYQRGSQRRSVIDNPKRDRIETYQCSNDAFVVEDYGCTALIENIEMV